jgi:hypothetical protein
MAWDYPPVPFVNGYQEVEAYLEGSTGCNQTSRPAFGIISNPQVRSVAPPSYARTTSTGARTITFQMTGNYFLNGGDYGLPNVIFRDSAGFSQTIPSTSLSECTRYEC